MGVKNAVQQAVAKRWPELGVAAGALLLGVWHAAPDTTLGAIGFMLTFEGGVALAERKRRGP